MKEYVKSHFDQLFSNKPILQYQFELESLGYKDKMIVRTLNEYGVEGKACLDIGPGTGRWIQFLRMRNPSFLAAIDISDSSLSRVADICDKTHKLDVEVDTFDFTQDFFDIILSFEVIEHLVSPGNYISEVIRVLKPGGIFLLTTPNLVSFISRLRMLFGLLPVAIACDTTHVKFYRKKDLKNIFSHHCSKIKFIPTSVSINPKKLKSRYSLKSNRFISSLDDSILCLVQK